MILKIIIGLIFLALVIVDFTQKKYNEAMIILCSLVVYTVINIMQVITR